MFVENGYFGILADMRIGSKFAGFFPNSHQLSIEIMSAVGSRCSDGVGWCGLRIGDGKTHGGVDSEED